MEDSPPTQQVRGQVSLKYADDGNFLWGRSTGSTQCQFGSNCGVYFNNIRSIRFGGIVVGGNYVLNYKQQGGTVNGGFGNWDVLVVRYDENDTVVDIRRWKWGR